MTEREFLEALFPVAGRDATTDQLLEFRLAAEGRPQHQALCDRSLLSHFERKYSDDQPL